MQASSLSPPTRSTSTPSSYTPLPPPLSFLTISTFHPLKLAPPPATAKTSSRAAAAPTAPPMADRDRDRDRSDRLHPQQIQVHSHQQPYRFDAAGGGKSILPRNGPSTGQVLAVVTLLPVGGSLLGLAALTLIGSLIGLAVATPLLVIFSPVLVPAALLLAGAVAAFLTSGAFGLTGLSSLSWVFNSFRQATGQEPFDYAKRRVQEGTMYVGEKTKQVGESIKSTAQEGVGGHHAGGGAGATATAGGATGKT